MSLTKAARLVITIGVIFLAVFVAGLESLKRVCACGVGCVCEPCECQTK